VHPSDTAVALVALQAQVVVAGPGGRKTVRIEDFFIGPDKSIEKENILAPNEIVTEIQLPAVAAGTRSSYRKIRGRGAWDFALTSVGLALQLQDDTVKSARIVLGGVGPYPWRAPAAEKAVTGKKLDPGVAQAAAVAAVEGATPLDENAYKITMVKGAVEESLLSL
jgi:xanthine dehydrogenase YagS FAD-binding subunit